MIWDLFGLAIYGDGFGAIRADYQIARDYCEKYALDNIEVWRVLKEMTAEYARAADKSKGKRR